MQMPFAVKTVDGVLAAFTRTLADLEQVSSKQEQIKEQKLALADKFTSEAGEAAGEAARARTIHKKLNDLLS